MSCQSFMQYTQLKAGDVRKPGDETTRKNGTERGPMVNELDPGIWMPVKLLGHRILSSDLIASSFRRPLS